MPARSEQQIEEPESRALMRWLDGKDQLVAFELVRSRR